MSTRKREVVVGAYKNPMDARRTIEQLRDAGFSDKDIGVLSHNKNGDAEVKSFKDLEGNKAGKGAAAGVAAGAGGGALWALGIAAGLLPAIGPVIAGGLLGAVLASGAAGAAAGGIAGALIGAGIDDEEAAYYEKEFHQGSTVVVVKAKERLDDVFRMMETNKAYHRPGTHTTTPLGTTDPGHTPTTRV